MSGDQARTSIFLLIPNDGDNLSIPAFHGSAAPPLKVPTGQGRYRIEFPDLAPNPDGTPLYWESIVD